MNIAVAGTGYVGLSIATLLAQHHHVTAVDILPEKVEKINRRQSPIQDEYIEKYLAEKELDLTATLDAEAAYRDADFVVIAAPTNYDSKKNYFDTSAVETVSYTHLDVYKRQLKKHGNKSPIMLSSSIQATLIGRYGQSDYGKSKLAGEELFFRYGQENGVKVAVYRFPKDVYKRQE